MTPQEILEGQLSRARIEELHLDPVKGSFDEAHLKEINRRIFQDFPEHGLKDVTPGQFREPIEGFGNAYVKGRKLEHSTGTFPVAYSKMDEAAQKDLNQALQTANPEALAKLDKERFVEAMSTLYAKLDYAHPFPEGNSRTLREYTRNLADAAGYKLDWQAIGKTSVDHDRLYIARDRAVFDLAKPDLNDRLLVHVSTAVNQLKDNPDLPTLIASATRPNRAIAFEQLPQDQALAKHPELKGAYEYFERATEIAKTEVPAAELQGFTQYMKSQLVEQLDRGEIIQSHEPQMTQEPDRER